MRKRQSGQNTQTTGINYIQDDLEQSPEPNDPNDEIEPLAPPSPEWQEVKRKVRTTIKPEVREYVPEAHVVSPVDYERIMSAPSWHEQLRLLEIQRQHARATKMVSPLRNFYRI